MKLPHSILPALALLLLAPSLPAATTLMETDFDSLATGAVTAANLNTVTTGGTWSLNGSRGADYTINDHGNDGDRAFLADDTNGGNAGVIEFAAITLGSVADFSTDAVTWSFNTATRRTGKNKGLRYEFLNGTTSVAILDWIEDANGVNPDISPNIFLSGTTSDNGDSPFKFLFGWVSDTSAVRGFDAVFEGTNLNLNFGAESLSVTLGSSMIDRLVVSSIGSEGAGAKGVFLDDMIVSQVPEPSSALVGGLVFAMLLARRRGA